MNKITTQFKQNNFLRFYFIPILIIWLIGLLFLFAKGYNDSFLLLNSYHSSWLDYPMLVLTMLGDAGFMAVVLIFLLIKKQPFQLMLLLIAIIISGILAQLLKHNLFSEWHRPPYLFKEQVHMVANYLLYHYSFPSGHSTTVAAVFTLLAIFRKEHKAELLFYAVICPLIAYTRVYLGVHFLGDAVAGILLGFICSMIIICLIKPFEVSIKPCLQISLKILAVISAIIILVLFLKENS
ncbi:MAG: phosphatase PAP2 family protein [Bacteroidales bacterium]